MNNRYYIRNARLLDPVNGSDTIGSLYIENGRIAQVPGETAQGTVIIDAGGLCVAPGFIDIHVHFREPGGEEAESIASGCAAAAKGGFTRVVMMPNTTPPLDSAEMITATINKAKAAGMVEILPAGCLTQGRAGGQVADLEAMRAAGAIAFTDDGSTVPADKVMEQAMKEAARLDCTVMDHALDPAIAGAGALHDGRVAKSANVPGIPSEAEYKIVERDIALCRKTGCRLHIQHVSTKEAVHLLAAARQEGLPVSGEVTPHHLLLCEDDVDPADPDYKMNPPLRSAADRTALREAVTSGIINVLATDHAPHTSQAKSRGMPAAPFGITGLETAIGITYTVLVSDGTMTLLDWVRAWTVNPAQVIGIAPASLQPGQPAILTAFNPGTVWTVSKNRMVSKSSNMPYAGIRLTGKPAWTFYDNRLIE